MRRDAAMRREALLAAAEQLLSREGYWVPLERIADAAQVGRGTLYRNFPDRLALALAVFDRAIDRIEGRIAEDMPLQQVLVALIRQAAPTTALFQRLAADLPLEGETLAAFQRLRERVIRLLRPLAAQAHQNGALRAEFGAEELLLATRMSAALLQAHMGEAEREAQIEQAVRLLMIGLAPNQASG